MSEARQAFASQPGSTATPDQRVRYALNASMLSKRDRHFQEKHPDLLPPPPMLANPVVRKAIFEVRRHLVAYLRKFGRKPDRIVIEMVRSAKQSEKVRNRILSLNRNREKIRKRIIDEFGLEKHTLNQQKSAADRVILCRQQRSVCPYSGNTITERQAAAGTDVEIDHIVAYSLSGDNSLSNKVLCWRNSNRGKANQTVKQWLKGRFEEFQTRFAHFEKFEPTKEDYFTKKDYARKWENFHREIRPADEWKNSQLTDTAYAARQVAAYLSDALYGGQTEGKQRIFFTKGAYTAILRKDWQLFQKLKGPSQESEFNTEKEQLLGKKQRGDHRHHAIDAVVISQAGPEILPKLAGQAAEGEEYHSRTGFWLKRQPLPSPWGNVREFRRQVLSRVFESFDDLTTEDRLDENSASGTTLIVSHRPIKRRLIGHLHKEDLWGAVDESQGIFKIRCQVAELTPKMLRMPVEETDQEAKKRLFLELRSAGIGEKDARKKAKELVEGNKFTRKLIDPSLGKGGLIRDWELRKIIRRCLENNGVNPDSFSSKEVAALIEEGKVRMPSGVPIKSVITIGPISDPVKIAVKDPFTRKQAINERSQKPVFRFHISRNNHHIEIRQNSKTGEWVSEVVTMFESMKRIREAKKTAVNRSDQEGMRFIFSLAEGETIHARRHDKPTGSNEAIGYYVVKQLNKKESGADTIEFVAHWDAGKKEHQDRWIVSARQLKECGPESGKPPYKIRVDPLGNVRCLNND